MRGQSFRNAHNLMDLLRSQPKGRERTSSEESVSAHGASGQLRSEILAKERGFGWEHLTVLRRLPELTILQLVEFGARRPK